MQLQLKGTAKEATSPLQGGKLLRRGARGGSTAACAHCCWRCGRRLPPNLVQSSRGMPCAARMNAPSSLSVHPPPPPPPPPLQSAGRLATSSLAGPPSPAAGVAGAVGAPSAAAGWCGRASASQRLCQRAAPPAPAPPPHTHLRQVNARSVVVVPCAGICVLCASGGVGGGRGGDGEEREGGGGVTAG